MTIIVNRSQRKNPLLNHAKFAKEFDDDIEKALRLTNPFTKDVPMVMVEDFRINPWTSVLYLTLSWHRTYPQYIQDRLSELYNKKKQAKKSDIMNIRFTGDFPIKTIGG